MKKTSIIVKMGLVLPLFFVILSILPIYRYCGVMTMVLPNRSIFNFFGFYMILAFLIYLYAFFYSFKSLIRYYNKNVLFSEKKQYISLVLSVAIFIITLVATSIIVKGNYILFFLK